MTQRNKKTNTQVVMKIPTAFVERFDGIADSLGYTRTEAIKEAMRRFEQWGEQRLMGRPEIAANNMRQMMEAAFGPLWEMVEKYEKSERKNTKKIVEVENQKSLPS